MNIGPISFCHPDDIRKKVEAENHSWCFFPFRVGSRYFIAVTDGGSSDCLRFMAEVLFF